MFTEIFLLSSLKQGSKIFVALAAISFGGFYVGEGFSLLKSESNSEKQKKDQPKSGQRFRSDERASQSVFGNQPATNPIQLFGASLAAFFIVLSFQNCSDPNAATTEQSSSSTQTLDVLEYYEKNVTGLATNHLFLTSLSQNNKDPDSISALSANYNLNGTAFKIFASPGTDRIKISICQLVIDDFFGLQIKRNTYVKGDSCQSENDKIFILGYLNKKAEAPNALPVYLAYDRTKMDYILTTNPLRAAKDFNFQIMELLGYTVGEALAAHERPEYFYNTSPLAMHNSIENLPVVAPFAGDQNLNFSGGREFMSPLFSATGYGLSKLYSCDYYAHLPTTGIANEAVSINKFSLTQVIFTTNPDQECPLQFRADVNNLGRLEFYRQLRELGSLFAESSYFSSASIPNYRCRSETADFINLSNIEPVTFSQTVGENDQSVVEKPMFHESSTHTRSTQGNQALVIQRLFKRNYQYTAGLLPCPSGYIFEADIFGQKYLLGYTR